MYEKSLRAKALSIVHSCISILGSMSGVYKVAMPRMRGGGFGSGSSHQYSHRSVTSAPSGQKRVNSNSSGHSRPSSSNNAIHHSNQSRTREKNLMDPPSFNERPTRLRSSARVQNSQSHNISPRSTPSDANNVAATIPRPNDTPLEPHLVQLMNEVNEENLEDEDYLFAEEENGMGHEQGDHDSSAGSATQKQRKPRGPLVGKDLAPKDGTAWEMQWNSDGQLVGIVAQKLAIRLGQYARKHHYFPIDIKDWRKVSKKTFEDMYKVIKKEYDIESHPDAMEWIKGSLNNKWRQWKSTLKKKHYLRYSTPEERLANLDYMVDLSQWERLVAYWESTKGIDIANKNKLNRSKKKNHHTTGPKSIARVREEWREEHGKSPPRVALYKKTFGKRTKDGKRELTKNKEVQMDMDTALVEIEAEHETLPESELTSKDIHNKVFERVFGPGQKKGMIGMGFGARKYDECNIVSRHRRKVIDTMRKNCLNPLSMYFFGCNA